MSKRPADEITKLYEDNVAWYIHERSQSPFREKKYLDKMIALLKTGDRILDVGCGVGQPIAEYLLRQGFAVKGVDGSKGMVERAKASLPQGEWAIADMRVMDLGQKFHAVLAWDSFFHLNQDDQRAMFPIFEKHLLPKGILMFTSGPDHGEAIGEMNGRELFHASLSADEYRHLLMVSGFEVLEHQVEDPECGGHTVWVCRLRV